MKQKEELPKCQRCKKDLKQEDIEKCFFIGPSDRTIATETIEYFNKRMGRMATYEKPIKSFIICKECDKCQHVKKIGEEYVDGRFKQIFAEDCTNPIYVFSLNKEFLCKKHFNKRGETK